MLLSTGTRSWQTLPDSSPRSHHWGKASWAHPLESPGMTSRAHPCTRCIRKLTAPARERPPGPSASLSALHRSHPICGPCFHGHSKQCDHVTSETPFHCRDWGLCLLNSARTGVITKTQTRAKPRDKLSPGWHNVVLQPQAKPWPNSSLEASGALPSAHCSLRAALSGLPWPWPGLPALTSRLLLAELLCRLRLGSWLL